MLTGVGVAQIYACVKTVQNRMHTGYMQRLVKSECGLAMVPMKMVNCLCSCTSGSFLGGGTLSAETGKVPANSIRSVPLVALNVPG